MFFSACILTFIISLGKLKLTFNLTQTIIIFFLIELENEYNSKLKKDFFLLLKSVPLSYYFFSCSMFISKLFFFFQPYDPKRSCWVPVSEGGFMEGVIDSAEGDKVSVKIEKEKRVLKKDQVQQVNPPKFEKCEDMSNLTYLNEASVLHNLKARYYSNLIYVSTYLVGAYFTSIYLLLLKLKFLHIFS